MKQQKGIVTKYKDILKNMDYGTNFESVPNLEDFLKEHSNYLSTDYKSVNSAEIQNLLSGEIIVNIPLYPSNINYKFKTISLEDEEGNNIILRLTDEISANIDVIAHIELITRGILVQDTKTKVLPVLVSSEQSWLNTNSLSYLEVEQKYSETYLYSNFFLGYLGHYIANAIKRNRLPLVLKTTAEFALIALFFYKLCVNAGCPKSAIAVISISENDALKHCTSAISIFVSLKGGS